MEVITKSSKIEKIVKLILITITGTILITISAKIKIPFYPVPMTMQTFVILLIGITLGYKIASATVMLYLFEGILGLPVFANSDELKKLRIKMIANFPEANPVDKINKIE